jgi:sec-independent protein translocase protein TatC
VSELPEIRPPELPPEPAAGGPAAMAAAASEEESSRKTAGSTATATTTATATAAAPGEGEPEDEVDAYRMTLLEHLVELRNRVIICAVALVVAVGITMPFGDEIFAWLKAPATPYFPKGGGLQFIKPGEALFIAAPVLSFQAWRFVAPGLYKNERRLVLPFAFFSTLCFAGGAAFCYYVVLPLTMRFLLNIGGDNAVPQITLESYLSFVTKLVGGFGLVFELPMAIFFLARIGMVTAEGLAEVRRYAIVAIFVIAAVITPPDVVSQLLMALPLVLLYEVGIVVAKVWGKKPGGAEAG